MREWACITGLGLIMVAGCKSVVSGPGGGECRTDADKESAVRCTDLHPDSGGWNALFGADLAGARYTPGVWSMDSDGVLSATRDEPIWSGEEYENFTLDLEYTFDAGANSGVLFYCDDIENWIPNSVEVQILDDYHPQNDSAQPFTRNGALFGHLPPKVNNVKPVGEWNRMTITAQGQSVKVVVNGEVAIDTDLSLWVSAEKNPDGTRIPSWLSRPMATLPTRGRIGLQGRHGRSGIYFRNIRIKSQ